MEEKSLREFLERPQRTKYPTLEQEGLVSNWRQDIIALVFSTDRIERFDLTLSSPSYLQTV